MPNQIKTILNIIKNEKEQINLVDRYRYSAVDYALKNFNPECLKTESLLSAKKATTNQKMNKTI
jgi:hypothetical protein